MKLTLENVSSKIFVPFSKYDWEAYSGCESKMPLICQEDTGVYVIDGEWITWNPYDTDSYESCEINDLV